MRDDGDDGDDDDGDDDDGDDGDDDDDDGDGEDDAYTRTAKTVDRDVAFDRVWHIPECPSRPAGPTG